MCDVSRAMHGTSVPAVPILALKKETTEPSPRLLDCYSTEEMKIMYPDDGYSENCLYGEEKDSMAKVKDIIICAGCKKRLSDERGD